MTLPAEAVLQKGREPRQPLLPALVGRARAHPSFAAARCAGEFVLVALRLVQRFGHGLDHARCTCRLMERARLPRVPPRDATHDRANEASST